MIETTTHWITGHQFECSHEGHKIVIDGDKKNGHGPKALLLSGLAGCSGVDVLDILEKMRVQVGGLTIEVEAAVADEHPKVFTAVKIIYKLKTAIENTEKIKKAVELSIDKYCGVAAMLRKNSPLDYEIVIE